MAVVQTVTIPLGREPDVLFGLKVTDLIWVGAAVTVDLAIWHGAHQMSWVAWAGLAVSSGTGLMLATVKSQEISLPHWIWRWGRFHATPHVFLP